jgi:cytochrome c oxidase subunit 2
MKHAVVVVVLTAILTLLVGFGLESIGLLPEQASEEGVGIDQLFSLMMWAIAFLFSLIMVAVLYSSFAFRRREGEEDLDGEYISGNSRLEIVWTVIPLAAVIGLGIWGTQVLADITRPEPDELVVEVTGFQFGWRFEYPAQGVTSVDLNLPRGKQVLLKLESLDVIHSFWVPEFRVKQDAVPGLVTELRITPTELGSYTLRCAELCGLSHAYMLSNVNVMEPADFDAWLAGEAEASQGKVDPVVEGEKQFQLSCSSCHSVDGSTSVGPTLLGSFGSERELSDGSVVTVDEEYLRIAILVPGEQIVAGFANVMPPSLGDTLSAQQIDALVAYIKSLSD